MPSKLDYATIFGEMEAAYDESLAAKRAEEERLLAPKRAIWEEQAAPMVELLLPALHGLRDAALSRGADMVIADYTAFGGYGGKSPSVEVHFEHGRTSRKTNSVRVQAIGDGEYYGTELAVDDRTHTYRPLPEGFTMSKVPLDEETVKSLVEYLALGLVISEKTPMPSEKPRRHLPRRRNAMAV